MDDNENNIEQEKLIENSVNNLLSQKDNYTPCSNSQDIEIYISNARFRLRSKKPSPKNQLIDLSEGKEKTIIYFPLNCKPKLLRTNFDYKLNYITKSFINNGNIDEYSLTKDYSCSCEYDCSDENCDCLVNHVQRYECNENCSCDNTNCKNRVVQKGISKKLKVDFISKSKGFGVFCMEQISKDEFVCEYIGQIISKQQAEDKLHFNLMKKKANYVLQIRENYEKMIINTFIDAENKGNVSRFLNHSCDPNLYFDIIRINHFIPQVAFFAMRDIEVGEELTFSYMESKINSSFDKDKIIIEENQDMSNSYKLCLCGAENCNKFLPS